MCVRACVGGGESVCMCVYKGEEMCVYVGVCRCGRVCVCVCVCGVGGGGSGRWTHTERKLCGDNQLAENVVS